MVDIDAFTLIVIAFLGSFVIVYLIIACCCGDDHEGFPCFLCKEKVTEKTWDQHRQDCARENEWFIEGLPKSEVS